MVFDTEQATRSVALASQDVVMGVSCCHGVDIKQATRSVALASQDVVMGVSCCHGV
jgi:hypothetical protein